MLTQNRHFFEKMLTVICSKKLPRREAKLPADLSRKAVKLQRRLAGKVEVSAVARPSLCAKC